MADLNTVCVTPNHASVDECSESPQSDRSCAIESTPVLRTKLHTMDRDFSCPEKRGGIQNIQPSNGSRVPDTLWDIFTVGEHGYCTNKLYLSDQANQPQQMSCRQPDRDRKSKSAQPIQTDAPIAIRTRSKVHQQDTASKCMVANETQYQSQFATETDSYS